VYKTTGLFPDSGELYLDLSAHVLGSGTLYGISNLVGYERLWWVFYTLREDQIIFQSACNWYY